MNPRSDHRSKKVNYIWQLQALMSKLTSGNLKWFRLTLFSVWRGATEVTPNESAGCHLINTRHSFILIMQTTEPGMSAYTGKKRRKNASALLIVVPFVVIRRSLRKGTFCPVAGSSVNACACRCEQFSATG